MQCCLTLALLSGIPAVALATPREPWLLQPWAQGQPLAPAALPALWASPGCSLNSHLANETLVVKKQITGDCSLLLYNQHIPRIDVLPCVCAEYTSWTETPRVVCCAVLMQIVLKQNPSNEVFVVSIKCLLSQEGAMLRSALPVAHRVWLPQQPSPAHLCMAHHLPLTEWGFYLSKTICLWAVNK